MKTEIRTVSEEIYDDVIDLLSRSFGRKGEYFERHQMRDPSYSYDQGSVLLEDGKIVSCVQVFHRPMRYGAGRIHVGAIADVATDPEHRRKGYATKLLENAVTYMNEEDLPLSLLYTGTQRLYEQSGWHVVPATVLEVSVPSEAKPGPRAYVVKPFDEPQLRMLAKYYDEAMSNLVGPLDRTIEYFERQPEWLDPIGEVHWDVIYKVGHPAGFVRTAVAGETLELLDVCGTGDEVIRVACAQATRRAIDSGCRRIRGRVAPGSILVREFAAFADIELAECESQMMRLNNLEGTLAGALPEFHRRRRHSPLPDHPVSLVVGDSAVRIEFPSATAALGTPEDDDERLELTDKQFLHMLMGVNGGLSPVTESNLSLSVKSQLSHMFPEAGHVFWSADAF
ncbi:MAG: GNAT family N-acetyltransferase [Gammaproteobacteria bacterium]|nr:GNAT family N-acetyltransferase [Gammaproteobacteria bacterium]